MDHSATHLLVISTGTVVFGGAVSALRDAIAKLKARQTLPIRTARVRRLAR